MLKSPNGIALLCVGLSLLALFNGWVFTFTFTLWIGYMIWLLFGEN